MAQFNLEDFLGNLSVQQLDVCRKDDLFEIASYFGINVSKSLLKHDLKSLIISSLVEKGVLSVEMDKEDTTCSESADQPEVYAEEGVTTPPFVAKPEGEKPPASLPRFEPFSVESSNPSVEARLKVRLVRLELEAKERERKDEFEFQLKCRRLEAETAIKMRQLELQSHKLTAATTDSVEDEDNISIPSNKPSSSPAAFTFDISKNIALVPPFRETEVEAYFNAFERIAVALHWPTDVWSLLLQCKLTGKAQEVCAALTIEDSLVYVKVKAAILRAYELVPEAYRQRFRALRKSSAQTFVEFAREKGMLFDRWCQATKTSDFTSLRELMLLEEYKTCLPDRRPEDEKSVRILRDTGGSQSFILSSFLPFNADTSCNADTIVQGIGMAYVPAPLHHVHLKSKLASGFFKVAVRNSFPVQGVEFIMGNDLAGGKVLPIPEVVDNPSCMTGKDEMLESHPDVFAVSALTRSQACKLKEVNLNDSVLGSALMEDKLPADDLSESAPLKEDVTQHAEKEDVTGLIQLYPALFGDVPSRTSVLEHDIDVGDASPIKQHPYRCPPVKREMMKTEVQYLVENGLAIQSPQASLTLNLAKCEFAKAVVTYLGKEVGHGQVRPVNAKVEAILSYPVPTTRPPPGCHRCNVLELVSHPIKSSKPEMSDPFSFPGP
ncbi:uncharacterized protein LOC116729628 [Xiphophorus hellerii]|uniref:uncharacterized protein LOC116729628 n=1 Tax=Xiphophorus hellerii TaxID=8084 RepID=UPI0013B36F4B|nr:uncharacterized protein LOC116729628 [Xiphophorus hellerii]